MDLRYNLEKRFRPTLDSKCIPEKYSRLNLIPKHTLSKRTRLNLDKKWESSGESA